ncbi:MAG: acetamidase/formamidase family protein [Actinobacteria bacterium]|nr:acetamidase/formamidase family protein [Actinomycetota bacterium]
MPEPLFKVELGQSMADQEVPGHNRWHPDIPAAAATDPGTDFRIECLDWTNGQVGNNDSANDVRDMDLDQNHVLSGPIQINGAEPGDVLVVDILNMGPFPGSDTEWGYTGIFSRQNGGGFLTDHYPDAHKAIWDLRGVHATSRHIPDVRFVGIQHPGLIGCAPSAELLAEWNRREQALIDTNPDRVPPLALPPLANNAIVYVEGAKLSMGDLHFSQGDGEISFCGAIEMAGYIDLGVDLVKGGMERYGMTRPQHMPMFQLSHIEPRYSNYLVFEGISVEEDGEQHYMNAHVAFKQACLNAITYLKGCGYTDQQAYILLSAAPIEGRISGIVDIPNVCCSLYLPTEIFERPIFPQDVPTRTPQEGSLATES